MLAGVSGCCNAAAYGRVFSDRWARRDARRYRRRGLDRTARRMLDFLRARGVGGRTVLEVGGGVGALALELVRAGAEHAANVELSPGYEEAARALARERGLEARVELLLLDFAASPDAVPAADEVVMHRVVCCYPDVDALVGAAADHARRHLVLSFPRDAWWTRFGFRLADLGLRVRGCDFRAYVRPADRVLAAARARGFRVALEHVGPVWQVAALERT